MQKATGGIEFTDEYGLYSISMSSNKRTISIDSPLGSVSINAFTGITISAPLDSAEGIYTNDDFLAAEGNTVDASMQRPTLAEAIASCAWIEGSWVRAE